MIFGRFRKNNEDIADRRRDKIDTTVILGNVQGVSVRPLDVARHHPFPSSFAHRPFVENVQLKRGSQNQSQVEISIQIWYYPSVDREISMVHQKFSGSFDVTKEDAFDADGIVEVVGVRNGAAGGKLDSVRRSRQKREPLLSLI